MEMTSQHLFPSRGASIFGQDLVLTMQSSSTSQRALMSRFRLRQTCQFMCENYS